MYLLLLIYREIFLIYNNFSLTFILKNFYKSVSVSIFIKLHATLKELQDKVFVVRAVVYRSKNKGSCQNYICLKPDLLMTMIWSLPSEREPAFKAWKFPFPYPFSSTILPIFWGKQKKESFSGIELTGDPLTLVCEFHWDISNLLFCFFSLSSRIFDKLKRKIHKKVKCYWGLNKDYFTYWHSPEVCTEQNIRHDLSYFFITIFDGFQCFIFCS